MNVLSTLDEELKGKNWDKETKARYIYLRCCEIFSFDSRYYYYAFLGDSKDEMNAKLSLITRKINLEDVLDFRVMCTTYTYEIYNKLMEELLGICCSEGETKSSHVFPKFLEPMAEMYEIKADATKSDLIRVKMGLETHGYHPVDKCFRSAYERRIEVMDDNIGYRNGEYADYRLERQAKRYFQNKLRNNGLKEEEFLLDIMYEIKKVFDSYNGFSIYSDAAWCIDHLRDIYFGQLNYPNEEELNLFQFRDNFEMDLVDLYPIRIGDDKVYFILEKREDKYSFYEIEKREAKHYRKEMNIVPGNKNL